MTTTASFATARTSSKKSTKRILAADFIEINTSYTAHPTGD